MMHNLQSLPALTTNFINIRDAVARIYDRMAEACHRSGRHLEDVRLVAVTKTFPADRVRDAYDAGLVHFAENRVQEAAQKRALLEDLPIVWHMIGHLQSNKAALASKVFDCIESLDSIALARKLDEARDDSTAPLPVLIQVNMAKEDTKSGFDEKEILPALEYLTRFKHIQVKGLMQIPPFCPEVEGARPHFRQLYELRERIRVARIEGILMDDLSMGMSHDFEVAIEEGATVIRVGRAIFGNR